MIAVSRYKIEKQSKINLKFQRIIEKKSTELFNFYLNNSLIKEDKTYNSILVFVHSFLFCLKYRTNQFQSSLQNKQFTVDRKNIETF